MRKPNRIDAREVEPRVRRHRSARVGPALASHASLDDETNETPAWFTASGHGHARAGEARRSDARMARGFLRVALLALVLCLAVDVGDASPVTKSEIGLSAGATRKLLAAHQYRMREGVPLYANKAGPFHNPSEVRRGSATPAKPAPTIVVEKMDGAGISRPERAEQRTGCRFAGVGLPRGPRPGGDRRLPTREPLDATRRRGRAAPFEPRPTGRARLTAPLTRRATSSNPPTPRSPFDERRGKNRSLRRRTNTTTYLSASPTPV